MPVVPRIPVRDQTEYLDELEMAVRESSLNWYFEYLEDRMFNNGYMDNYDSMAAWFMYSRGFRVRYDAQGQPSLSNDLVSKRDLNSIRATYQRLHGRDYIINPYKRQRFV